MGVRGGTLYHRRPLSAVLLLVLLASGLVPPTAAAPIRVVINEVLHDPAPGGHEWVELYNAETVGVNIDGWVLSDEDGYAPGGAYYTVPDIPDMPPGARIVVHFMAGVDDALFNGGVLNLYSGFADVLEPSDQLALYSGTPRDPTTIQDYVDWLQGGAVSSCSAPALASRAGEQYWDDGVALASLGGRLHAVWASADPAVTTGTDVDIVGRDFGVGSWGGFDEINTPGDSERQGEDPALAVNAGDLYSFWTTAGTSPGLSQINYSVHNGTRWADEQSLEAGPANTTHASPDAAAFGGDLYAVWQRVESGTNPAQDIVYKRFSGTGWSSLGFVSGPGDRYYDSSPYAAEHGGALTVFWIRRDIGGAAEIVLRAFDGTSWGSVEVAVNASEAGGLTNQVASVRAASFEGALHLVWAGYGDLPNGTTQSVYHRAFGAAGWGPIGTLSASGAGQGYATAPDLVASSSALHAVWSAYGSDPGSNSTGTHIIHRSLAGGVWAPEAHLTTGPVADQDPVIAVLGSAVYVAWTGYNAPTGGDGDIYYCRLQVTSSFGDDENAVVAGIWTPGTFVNTTGMAQNLTLYRIVDGGDSDSPGDWSFADALAPVARAGPDLSVMEDRLLAFDGSGSFDNLAVVRHLWDADASDGLDWGDPDMVGVQVSWVYSDWGLSRATLRVEDAAGNWATDEVVVDVAFDFSNNTPANVTSFAVSPTAIFRTETATVYLNGTDDYTPEVNLTPQFEWRARSQLAWQAGYTTNFTFFLQVHTATFTPVSPAPIDRYSLRARLIDRNGSYSGWTVLVDALDVRSDLPTADAGPDLMAGEDVSVLLDGSLSTDNRQIRYWSWDLGNGYSGASAVPYLTWVWPDPGVYVITLTVTDSDGNTDTDTAIATILDTTRPLAAFSGPAVIEEDHGATFSAATSSDNVGIALYVWDFGDGTVESGASPIRVHAFDTWGTYTIALSVFDAAGNNNTTGSGIYVRNIITVNDDGDEDFTTIQAAIDSIPVSDRGPTPIYVHSGIYRENVTVNKSVLLEGSGSAVTFVQGATTAFRVTANATRITGFTIRGANTCVYLDRVGGFSFDQNRVEDCDTGLHAFRTTNSYIAWNVFTRGSYGIISDNVLDDAYRWNEISYYTIYGAKSYDAQLVNCFNWNRFHHNQVAYFYDPTRALDPLLFDGNELWENEVALRVQDADTLLVRNNTFRDNERAVELLNASPEIFLNDFIGEGVALTCDRSNASVHDNDFTAMAVVRVDCVRANGFRFEGNALGDADLRFEDSVVAALDLPAGSASFTSSGTDPGNVRLGTTATATYGWRLTVRVLDRYGGPVAGADVYVRDAAGATVASALTDAEGRTPPMLILAIIQFAPTRGGLGPQGPFEVTATVDGHAATETITLAADAEVPVALPTYPALPPPPPEEPPPFPAWAMVSIASLLFAGGIASGGVAGSEVGRWHLWLLALPLFTRLRKEEILEQPTRNKIHGFILGSPGAHFALIGSRLGLAHGQLAYHLDVLTKEGMIFARSDGFKKRFYPADTPPELVQDFVLSDVQEKVLEVIVVNPGIGQKALSMALGVTRQVISYHVEKLEKFSKVRKVGDGRNAQYYVRDEGKGWMSTAPTNGQL